MRGLRALHAGDRLVAVGLRLFQQSGGSKRRCAASSFWRSSSSSMRVGRRLGGNELRPGLLDRSFLGRDLMADARDGRFLGRDFVARRIDGEPIVAVIDGGDHVAGVDVGVVGDRDVGEIAGHLGGQRRVIGLHIGVIGRDREPADRHTVVAEPASAATASKRRRPRPSRACGGSDALRLPCRPARFRPDVCRSRRGCFVGWLGRGRVRNEALAPWSSGRFSGLPAERPEAREGLSLLVCDTCARTPVGARDRARMTERFGH